VEEGWQRSVRCADMLSATAMLFQSPASLRAMLARLEGDASAYIIFNDLQRVANATAFLRLLDGT
jgi:hypothetical protein